jgi:hypothetical protein
MHEPLLKKLITLENMLQQLNERFTYLEKFIVTVHSTPAPSA